MNTKGEKIVQTRARKRAERNNRYSNQDRKRMSIVLSKLYKESFLNMAGVYRKLDMDKNTFRTRLDRGNWLDQEIDVIISLGISPFDIQTPSVINVSSNK